MNARILAPEEWARLDASGLPDLLAFVRPQDVAVVAVEDGATIAASLAVLQVTHFEGVWVDPRYRGNPGVMRPLLRQAWAIPRARGERWAFGGAADGDDRMRGFLAQLGGVEMPLRFHALAVGGEACRT